MEIRPGGFLFLNILLNEIFKLDFRYVILNVQKEINYQDNTTRYAYKEVGNWNNENKLSLDLSKLVFPNNEKDFVSICSKECEFGYVKVSKFEILSLFF